MTPVKIGVSVQSDGHDRPVMVLEDLNGDPHEIPLAGDPGEALRDYAALLVEQSTQLAMRGGEALLRSLSR